METKIVKVILYKHGIASFERVVQVKDNESISLYFKQSEMNDVLKSLTVIDANGGSISSISYDNNKPIDRRISESPFTVGNLTSLNQIISQLTGVEVSLSYEDQTLNGIIASTAEVKQSNGQAIDYISLWHDNTLKFLELQKTSNIVVKDPLIQKQLTQAITMQNEKKIKEQKKVTILANGNGERQINISYFIEAPVWKVSYRVVIPESIESPENDKANANANKTEENNFILQAWAIVDNITEEKWDNVQLTLISGDPHSCEVDLFNPIYKKAESAGSPYDQQHRVQKLALNNMNNKQQVMGRKNMMQQQCSNMLTQQIIDDDDNNQEATSTKEIGDMFQYNIVNTVSVASNQSALVPIAEKKVTGSRVAVYNEEKHSGHPNSAILLVNTTGLTLEGGPCAIVDSGTFVGESMISTVQRGETKFIEYATEISSDIWKTYSTTEKLHKSSISNATLYIEKRVHYITNYNLRNKSQKDITMYIEHRFRKDCKLVDTPDPTNPKPIQFYIFKTTSPASDTVTFTVTEEGFRTQSIDLRSMSRGSYNAYVADGSLSGNASQAAKAYLDLRDAVANKQNEINSLKQDIQKIFENHNRIRSNLSSLHSGGSANTLRERYIQEMSDDETKLASINAKIKNLEEEKQGLSDEAENIVNSISS